MKLGEIKIKNKTIGLGHPVFIIAEAGVNHNGDLNLAKKLVYEAKACGADCVKFQVFKAERLVSPDAPKAAYQLKTTRHEESQLEMLRKLELSEQAHKELFNLCKKIGILYLATPCNLEDVDFLENLGVPAHKIASAYAVEPLFLKYIAAKGKPVLLSTGMCGFKQVKEAVRIIRKQGNKQIIALQCTTNYPSALDDTNLQAMRAMSERLRVLTGYSDHTANFIPAVAAVALGACLIERHFTLDKTLPGPDQRSSSTPGEFVQMVKFIRQAQECLGSNLKKPTAIEKENAKVMRRGLFTKKEIKKGEIISEENITFKRPAKGIPASFIEKVIGRRAKADIPADSFIDFRMIK